MVHSDGGIGFMMRQPMSQMGVAVDALRGHGDGS